MVIEIVIPRKHSQKWHSVPLDVPVSGNYFCLLSTSSSYGAPANDLLLYSCFILSISVLNVERVSTTGQQSRVLRFKVQNFNRLFEHHRTAHWQKIVWNCKDKENDVEKG